MAIDRQAMFNKAVIGLSTQGFRQSMFAGSDRCAFRGEGGLKCALGHLIDTKVLMGLPKANASDPEPQLPTVRNALGAVTDGDHEFFEVLVLAHDGLDSRTPGGMAQAYIALAKQRGLTIPPELAQFGEVQPMTTLY